eukprot:jgi/Chlat1/6589/Chrsp46S06086
MRPPPPPPPPPWWVVALLLVSLSLSGSGRGGVGVGRAAAAAHGGKVAGLGRVQLLLHYDDEDGHVFGDEHMRRAPELVPTLKARYHHHHHHHHRLSSSSLITFNALAHPGQAALLVEHLRRELGAVAVSGDGGDHLSFSLPRERVADLHHAPALRFAVASSGPRTNAGRAQSQGDRAMQSGALRLSVPGLNGTGVKVGILSDSYNVLHGAAADIASGDLPRSVTLLKESDMPGDSDAGRAMMQLVYDVAPGASLYFYTANGGKAAFANGIRALANAGCSIIVDNVSGCQLLSPGTCVRKLTPTHIPRVQILYPDEAFFQDDVIAQAVDEVKVKNNVVYIASAGNLARESWETVSWGEDRKGYYVFNRTGGQEYQRFRVAARDAVEIILQWDQPWNNSQVDLDIFAYDGDPSTSPKAYDYDITNNIGGQPLATLYVDNLDASTDLIFYLAINRYSGPAPGRVKYVWLSRRSGSDTGPVEFTTDSATIYGHANTASALTVAAAYFRSTPPYGVSPAKRQPYSSVGGTPILFDPSGSRLSAPTFRQQPQITGPDGVDNTFYGRDTDGNGLPNFFGTSAAAPHVAAVAALLRQGRTSPPADKLYSALRLTADDMDNEYTPRFDVGFDPATGYGFINAPAAYVATRCRTACGRTHLPWPFHLDPGCGPDAFTLGCYSTSATPVVGISAGTFPVTGFYDGYVLVPSAATSQLTAYACPEGVKARTLSTVGSAFSISSQNVVMAYGVNRKQATVTMNTYGADGKLYVTKSCTTSTSSSSSLAYCNGTSCCAVSTGPRNPARVSFTTNGPCTGANILYPPAVATYRVTPRNAKDNYFLRLDFSAPPRPLGTQGCPVSVWGSSTYSCRWPSVMRPYTRVRDALVGNANNKALVDEKYPQTLTMQQALVYAGTNQYYLLAAQAAAALLNAYQVRYSIAVSTVQYRFAASLSSSGNPTGQAAQFAAYNSNRWCPVSPCPA